MNDNEKIGNLIFDISLKCEEILKKEISPKSVDEEATLVAYYLSVIEYSKSTGILVKENKLLPLPHICRSTLEAVVDILNLCKDLDYYYVLRKISLEGNKKRFESWYENDSNPFHPEIEKLPIGFKDAQKGIKISLKELNDSLKLKFRKDITDTKARFEEAELLPFYESIFWQTSSDIHNDLSHIWNRHIEEINGKVVFHTSPKDGLKKYSPHINLIINLLITGLISIYNRYKEENFNKYLLELEVLRQKIESLTSFPSPVAE
ncbi:MAG: hypothetical protein JXR20_01195 [Balneola sp.]